MEKFDFGGISIPVKNNYSDIRTARESRDNFIPQDSAKNLINCLSSFYRENKLLSPENRGKLNTLLISLAVTLLSSDINSHAPEKETDIKTTPDASHSLELEEVSSSTIQETKFELSPIEIKNEPPSKIENRTHSSVPQKESAIKAVEDFSMENMEDAVEEIYILSELLSKNENLFPQKLFTETLLIAQDIAESDLKIDAQSKKGAIGKGQLQPNTLKEDIRYLHILKRSKIIDISLPPEDQLTQTDIEKICDFVKTNEKYADAFKKIYLMDLFNNFKIGQKDYATGEITKARKKILAAYNWNPTSFKNHENQEKEWPTESQNYYKKIFHYMEIINKIEARMTEMKMLTHIHDLSPILTLEIKKYERELSEADPKFDETIEKVMQGYLDIISEMEKIKEKPLVPEEVKRLIDKFNPSVYKDYKNYIASISNKKARL